METYQPIFSERILNIMRCDECKFWKRSSGYDNDYGRCREIGSEIEIDVRGDAYIEKIETPQDFFCAKFKEKE